MQFNTGEFSIGAPAEVPEFPRRDNLYIGRASHPRFWQSIQDFAMATAPVAPGFNLPNSLPEYYGLTIRVSYVEPGAKQIALGWHRDFSHERARVHILSTLAGNTTEFATDPFGNARSTETSLTEYDGGFISPPPNCWVTMDTARLHRSRPAEVGGWRMLVRLLEK